MSPYSKNGYEHYQKANVTLASPEGLVVLLYSEMVCCLVVAKEAFLMHDGCVRDRNVAKAVEILAELMGSLDMEAGKDVALRLATLYKYVVRKLLVLRREPTLELFDELIKILTPLKEAWETIAIPNASLKMALK